MGLCGVRNAHLVEQGLDWNTRDLKDDIAQEAKSAYRAIKSTDLV